MTIATTSSTVRRSLLQHIPELALALAGTAVVLLALGPIGWRAGWWHFRFSLLTLMPWAAYVGLAAVIVSALALVIGLSRLDWRGIALALVALIGGGLIAYVPWHYDQLRQTLPPIHDITTDPDNPPAFVAVVLLRQGEGINPVAYEGGKIAEQQRRAYPDVVPLTVGLAPDVAFARALDTAQRMGWTIVASDKATGQIEASQRSRWMGFTDDIVVRVAPANLGSRIDLRSSSRYGAAISASTPSAFGLTSRRCGRLQPAHFGTDWALGSAGRQQDSVSVDQDCVAYSRTALFGDGRLRTTKPGFVDGAEAVISGCVSVIDRCAVSRAGHPPKRSLWVAQVSG
jgi:uncharacterized protein (DUF1499 family)